ncbi:transporter [Scardovia inopinata]|uniref:Citrate transporter-like domain-containing protein n=1 Tax=Scardovia inopinata F0304 TaxID=641146 RepID=W5IIV0_SCAIO|nr:SLC13 family permease [Scardovia inopinata]EFG26958.1 hypothetical protein HMPREF9020_00588 [Scardovia inopinata F0304]SUV52081.1 transporter [Scardovia inopinata]
MRRWVLQTLRRETILVIASILAIISCFIVPPDAQYTSYSHTHTVAQLVCLMLVVTGLQRIGVFRIIGAKMLSHARTPRFLVLIFISLTFFSSMFITNDVALVTFVPFAIAVLIMAKMEDRTVFVVTLMTLGANLGSMLTPIGNAHNLYLKAKTGMPIADFMLIMLPYSFLAALLLIIATCIFFTDKPIPGFEGLDAATIERNILAPDAKTPAPDEIRITGYGAGYGGWRLYVYIALFIICILAVGGIMPMWGMIAICLVAFLFCDRRAFIHVDWGLPLTFIAFFIFIGNMKRVPEFYTLAANLVQIDPLDVAVGSSQLISNVPTTLLLANFSSAWKPLIIGTNLGGLGTLIASMASLVSFKAVTSRYPHLKGKYLAVYTATNLIFLAILLCEAHLIL